jgi:hypothetical protein
MPGGESHAQKFSVSDSGNGAELRGSGGATTKAEAAGGAGQKR